jgi:transposase
MHRARGIHRGLPESLARGAPPLGGASSCAGRTECRARSTDPGRTPAQITKAGPGHARRLLVEAAHHYRHPPRIGQTLAGRQHGQDPRIIEIAWRAQRRLHQRWTHPRHQRRKPTGVVAIACARELAAFCWEAATLD